MALVPYLQNITHPLFSVILNSVGFQN